MLGVRNIQEDSESAAEEDPSRQEEVHAVTPLHAFMIVTVAYTGAYKW